jgi:hypothetical protein
MESTLNSWEMEAGRSQSRNFCLQAMVATATTMPDCTELLVSKTTQYFLAAEAYPLPSCALSEHLHATTMSTPLRVKKTRENLRPQNSVSSLLRRVSGRRKPTCTITVSTAALTEEPESATAPSTAKSSPIRQYSNSILPAPPSTLTLLDLPPPPPSNSNNPSRSCSTATITPFAIPYVDLTASMDTAVLDVDASKDIWITIQAEARLHFPAAAVDTTH